MINSEISSMKVIKLFPKMIQDLPKKKFLETHLPISYNLRSVPYGRDWRSSVEVTFYGVISKGYTDNDSIGIEIGFRI